MQFNVFTSQEAHPQDTAKGAKTENNNKPIPEKSETTKSKVDPHEQTEEGKAFRGVVQKFVDALYDNPTSLQTSDILHQITDALKFEYGRVILGKVLLNDPRISDVCF